MTRGVLLAYYDLTPGGDVARLAGDYFLKWVQGEWPGRTPGSTPLDIGGATADGLHQYHRTRDPDRAGAGPGRAGNGSLMRCIPTGLFQTDPERLVRESERISKITHDDARCTAACAVYNTIVAQLVGGDSPVEAVAAGAGVAAKLDDSGEVSRAVDLGKRLDVSAMAQQGPPKQMRGQCSGFVLETLSVAIAAVLDSRSLEDVLVDVVRIGKDTDTNGAVAGGLLGARDGEEGIPERWRRELQFGNDFKQVALDLLDRQSRR